MIWLIILANLLATGAALLLIKRGPSRRLKQLALVVGLMTLAQTAAYIHSVQAFGVDFAWLAGTHELLVAALSLAATYLLGLEIYERRSADQTIRLMQHELSSAPVTARAAAAPLVMTDATPVRAAWSALPGPPLMWTVDQPAKIIVLSESVKDYKSVSATVCALSADTAFVLADKHIAPGSPVCVELDEGDLLGEVTQCTKSNGRYAVCLHTEPSVLHLRSLQQLIESVVKPIEEQSVA